MEYYSTIKRDGALTCVATAQAILEIVTLWGWSQT